MSQGDSSEQRDIPTLVRLEDCNEDMLLRLVEACGEGDRLTLGAPYQEVLRRMLAEVVGLREQLAAAERERDTLRAVERVIHKHRKRAEVAVGRLEKAQAALRELERLKEMDAGVSVDTATHEAWAELAEAIRES